ncbi:putative MFS family arabinose efflux permease [Azospirillum fermentarium]|uniref:hypothetical protein n=1 Tax=Azospirillum fermentarium TaxID=1233114 RepID=UPI00222793FD|nr:hypothetical protein [Azospirillum fermentarium]MCW2246627.1 putative MFS family arabinose efflux permease [Azospirillum fermentarium]
MKGLLLATASVAALALGAGSLMRYRARRRVSPPPPAREPPSHDVQALTRNFLLYYIVPLWLMAGVADWYCHRATHIEDTAGAKESMLHLLMLVEMGVPTLAGLFLEINSPVLGLMIASFILHEATALWDVSYAVSRREVPPIEQHIHSFLEMLPLMAASFVSLLHWPQVQALAGLRDEENPGIRWKQDTLPTGYLATVIGAIAVLELLPYAEELWRDWRAHPGRLAPPEAQAAAARQRAADWLPA